MPSEGQRPRLSNRVEQAVLRLLDQALAYHPDACRCPRCRRDVVALALRRLPARYAGSATGEVLIDVELQRVQVQAELRGALDQAIRVVKARPHHDRPA
ncbi:MAG: late competence development ComFB family protein [Firmicutes bacterium]|nr:late competence development ComFB family protein [Bacillota bacterium]